MTPAGDDGSRIVIKWSRNSGGRGGSRGVGRDGGRRGIFHLSSVEIFVIHSSLCRWRRTPRQRKLSSIYPLHSPENKP